MSTAYNGIGFSQERNPLSMRSIINQPSNRADSIKRAQEYLGYSPQGVPAVNLQDLFDRYPEVNSEQDVDAAADLLVQIFNSPRSRRFYCDCARNIKDINFIKEAVKSAFQPKIISPPAYFGRICTKRLVKLGVYK